MRRPKPEKPGPGQESVWDYPRPPRLEETRALREVDGSSFCEWKGQATYFDLVTF